VLLVHNKIHYVPVGDGWEEVLVRNVSIFSVWCYPSASISVVLTLCPS
jgi:hypothetical protein